MGNRNSVRLKKKVEEGERKRGKDESWWKVEFVCLGYGQIYCRETRERERGEVGTDDDEVCSQFFSFAFVAQDTPSQWSKVEQIQISSDF